MNVIVALFISFMSFSALATTPEYIELSESSPRLELFLGLGSARQAGYLTTEDSVGALNMGLNFLSPGGMMSFEWNQFSADHDTGEFSLNNNHRVQVSTFSFLPQVKIVDRSAWAAYLGFGLAQVSLFQNNPDYYLNYGTFIIAAQVRYQFADRWSAFFKSQWYGVRQEVNDQETGFEVWNNALGVAWAFR